MKFILDTFNQINKRLLFKYLKKVCELNKLNGITLIFQEYQKDYPENQEEVIGFLLEDQSTNFYYFDSQPIYLSKKVLIEINNAYFNHVDIMNQMEQTSENDLNIFLYYICFWKNFKIRNENE